MRNTYDVIIVGSGAAGFGTADWLHRFGVENVCIVTENVNYGTSRNAGSDKQTYYKPDICSDEGDSVRRMAQDLFAGGSMNGSDAFVEAAESLRCFMRLADLGVPFPTDAYGRYVGYRTDHDNTMRATSAGPLTSKFMTEALQKKVIENGTEILDGYIAVKLIASDGVCGGVVCLTPGGMRCLRAKAVILCTGAPAGIYSRSVYPACQTGATGLAVEAGAALSNFQEWQYGIASVKFRWNLSGSYQQVIPVYYSVDENGNEKEFLTENRNKNEIYSKVFLKGYQWPFDSEKSEGSSEIDLLVFAELEKGRRVFLDYRRNPEGFDFDALSDEAKKYLTDTESTGNTPFERLKALNPKAIKLYLDNGIDLEKEPLEIGVCAQHNNGGIKTDINSESTVKNLFAVGEAAGKFGVRRPGGSALNDTQVSGLRAARYLAKSLPLTGIPDISPELPGEPAVSCEPSLDRLKSELSEKMSDCAGVYRDYEKVRSLLDELTELSGNFAEAVTVPDASRAGDYYRFRSTVLSQRALCATVLASIVTAGSRGGCVCYKDGVPVPENREYRNFVTVTENYEVKFVPVDRIPDEKPVFEKLLKGEN